MREFVVGKQRREDQHDRDVTQAWHTIRIFAQTWGKKRLPPLKDQYARSSKGRPQSAGEIRAVVEMLSVLNGTRLRTTRKEGRGQ